MFEDETPRESSNHKRQKGVAPARDGTTHVTRTVLPEQLPQSNGSETAHDRPAESQTKDEKKAAKDEKQKKKRRRSKKDKNTIPPPKLVRAQTQLNELKNVKPLLQQSPQVRQQHFEQVKDAYALDEEANKVPSSDSRSRFFTVENWRKSPTPSGKNDSRSQSPEPPASLTRSHVSFRCSKIAFFTVLTFFWIDVLCFTQTSGASRSLSASSGRSSRGTEEISNEIEDFDVESLPLPPASRTSAITAPTITTTPSFLAASNQVEHGRPDIQTTPIIRVKTSERRSRRSLRSQRLDLRLDDVDEDLMEHILTTDDH